MENRFKRMAQEATMLSPIMAGRSKLTTNDIVGKELKIIEFGFAPKFDSNGNRIINESTGEVDEFAVLVFEEHPDSYYCAGTVFSKVCQAWMTGFPTPEEASFALKEEGGVRVRFSNGKTKKGNNLVEVEILD